MPRWVRPLPVLLIACLAAASARAQAPKARARTPGIVIIDNGRLRDPSPPLPQDDSEEPEPPPAASVVGGAMVQNACVEAANASLSSALVRVHTDVAYGPAQRLNALDLYVPPGAGPHPVLLFVHGGGFSLGDKGPHGRKARAFAQAGYLFVSVNYRLAPAAKHPHPTQDVAQAVRWVKANIARYGGDPSLLFLSGYSAGAHLSALLAVDARYLEPYGMRPQDLSGVILLDGAGYDIAMRLKKGNRRTWKMYTDAFGLSPTVWKEASPSTQVELGEDLPPFLIMYAGSLPGPRMQAQTLASALQWAGARVDAIHIPERNHDTMHKKLGSPGDRATERILSFLEEQRVLRTGLMSQESDP